MYVCVYMYNVCMSIENRMYMCTAASYIFRPGIEIESTEADVVAWDTAPIGEALALTDEPSNRLN